MKSAARVVKLEEFIDRRRQDLLGTAIGGFVDSLNKGELSELAEIGPGDDPPAWFRTSLETWIAVDPRRLEAAVKFDALI